MSKHPVTLDDELSRSVTERVASGRYEDASEVVRDALQALDERDELHAEYLASLRRDIEISRAQIARGEFHSGSAAEHMARIDEMVRKRTAPTP